MSSSASVGRRRCVSDVVLDASALLALIHREPGSERVAPMMPRAVIGAVNMAEVVGKLAYGGLPEDSIRAALGPLGIHAVAFDEEQALEVGLLRNRLGRSGLSLADLCCLTLAGRLGAPAITADRKWLEVDADVDVITIR
jgi:PIN domain nuclease of toxin-antitoxin system